MRKLEKRSPEGAISAECLADYSARVETLVSRDGGVTRDWAHVWFPSATTAAEWAYNTGMRAQCRFRDNPPALSMPAVLLVSLHRA